MQSSRFALVLVLAACSGGDMPGAVRGEPDAPSPDARVAPDALVPSPDALVPAPDAPTPAPDAPGSAPDGGDSSACMSAVPTVVVSPRTSPATAAGTEVAFDVAVTNNDSLSCAPTEFELRTRLDSPSFPIVPTNAIPLTTGAFAPGETRHLAMTAVPNDAIAGQTIVIPFDLSLPANAQLVFVDAVQMVVAEPLTCHVSVPRELMFTDVSVVEDPVRTDPTSGVWTFKHLVEEMAPTPAEAPAMVEAMFQSFTDEQRVNGFVVPPRSGFEFLLAAWPRLQSGELDLRAAPLRLNAIVNRFDLRNLAAGDGG